MAITGQVRTLVKQFAKDHPEASKVKLTSGDRTAEEQLEILLQPKQEKNYLHVKKSFLAKFKLAKLPAFDDLAPEQTAWWVKAIKAQAGKPRGFAHVGGKAQDVSLKGLDAAEREALRQVFEAAGLRVFNEYVTDKVSNYKVTVQKANVFHVYKK